MKFSAVDDDAFFVKLKLCQDTKQGLNTKLSNFTLEICLKSYSNKAISLNNNDYFMINIVIFVCNLRTALETPLHCFPRSFITLQ